MSETGTIDISKEMLESAERERDRLVKDIAAQEKEYARQGQWLDVSIARKNALDSWIAEHDAPPPSGFVLGLDGGVTTPSDR